MSNNNQDFLDKIGHFVTVIPQKYLEALLAMHEIFEGKNIKWVVNGDLAERLRVIKVDPDCVEIVTSKYGAQQIFVLVQEFDPSNVSFQIQQLQREAVINGEQFPVYSRSYYFDFNIKGVAVKVHGDLQYKVGSWEWGEVFDFDPECVYIIGEKISVTPLRIKHDFYQALGWVDRVEKIDQIIKKPFDAKRQSQFK
jgi:hypothetical protein